MELLFIISIGAAMTLLSWAVLLPFSEFHSAVRAAASFLYAVWDGWFRFFGRLALSNSLNGGRRDRFRQMPSQASHVRRLLVAACTGGDAGHTPGPARFAS